LSREEAAQQRGKKLLQAVAGIRPGSEATASWGVIRHQKVRVFAGLYSMKEMMAPERRHGDDDVSPAPDRSAMHKRITRHPSEQEGPATSVPAAIAKRAGKRPKEH
jgi:hypothetical protein